MHPRFITATTSSQLRLIPTVYIEQNQQLQNQTTCGCQASYSLTAPSSEPQEALQPTIWRVSPSLAKPPQLFLTTLSTIQWQWYAIRIGFTRTKANRRSRTPQTSFRASCGRSERRPQIWHRTWVDIPRPLKHAVEHGAVVSCLKRNFSCIGRTVLRRKLAYPCPRCRD